MVFSSLWPHGQQYAKLPCPILSPGVCSDSFPLSRWCQSTVSSSVTPFCLQSFPASGSFSVSQLFTSGGQSIGASASASVLPVNIQDWFPSGLTGLISLGQRDSLESSPALQFENITAQLSHLYMITGKTIALTRWTFVSKMFINADNSSKLT